MNFRIGCTNVYAINIKKVFTSSLKKLFHISILRIPSICNDFLTKSSIVNKMTVSYIESANGDSMADIGFVSYPKLTEPLLFNSLD